MTRKRETHDLLPLTPLSFHILLALAGGDRHGYAIIKEMERKTGGAMRPGTGTLYAAIQRLLDDGLIEVSPDRPNPEADDRRRKYYRLTAFGRGVAAAEAQRLRRLVHLAAEVDLVPRLVTGSDEARS